MRSASIYSRRQGPTYGKLEETPQTLATKLVKRCMQELVTYTTKQGIPKKVGAQYFTVSRYAMPYRADPGDWNEGAYYFQVSRYERVPTDRGPQWHDEPTLTKERRLWFAQIVVTPELDVIIDDPFGPVERAVLSCALRGPDR